MLSEQSLVNFALRQGAAAYQHFADTHRVFRQFLEQAGSADKVLKLYDGHYHDLLNDVGKEQVMADITGWIEARLPKA